VLKGAEDMLRRSRYLQIEVLNINMRKIRSFLKRCGFRKVMGVVHDNYKNIVFENLRI